MNSTDRQILEFCLGEFRPLKPLTGSIPSGTLYRHVNRLVRLAWLRKEANLYQTTNAGRHQLAQVTSGQSWDAVAEIYPPLALVPTAVHRALIELIVAAIVARQHEIRPDRHPFFVAYGSTLRWKTSLGRFVCHALGLDPAVQIVDCGSEAGRSLTFRRGSDGTLVSVFPPKNGKIRRVDLSDQLAGALRALVVERKAETLRRGWPEVPEWVFCSEAGTPLHKSDFERRVFHKLLAKTGLRKVRFHDLRHTFASRLLQNGESPVYGKEQMGHSSIKVTVDIYGHLVPGANRAAVNRLDDAGQAANVRNPDTTRAMAKRVSVLANT